VRNLQHERPAPYSLQVLPFHVCPARIAYPHCALLNFPSAPLTCAPPGLSIFNAPTPRRGGHCRKARVQQVVLVLIGLVQKDPQARSGTTGSRIKRERRGVFRRKLCPLLYTFTYTHREMPRVFAQRGPHALNASCTLLCAPILTLTQQLN
jgi:hypothetical protein